MSRGLGVAQRALLAYADRFRGEPVGYVAEHLGVTERRARKIVQSLVERGLVVVVGDPNIGRRVWTPERYGEWRRAQGAAEAARESAKLSNRTGAGTRTAR